MRDTSNVVVREHFKARYCERIIGLETVIGKEQCPVVLAMSNSNAQKAEVERCIKAYITLNDEHIIGYGRRMLEHAEFIYKGQLGGDNTTKCYYMRDDIILVADSNTQYLITLYRVDFGFGDKDKELALWLKENIFALQKQHEEAMAGYQSMLGIKQAQIADCDVEIKLAEARIEALRNLKKAAQAELDGASARITLIAKEWDSKAHQLCNNYDFKKDLAANAK